MLLFWNHSVFMQVSKDIVTWATGLDVGELQPRNPHLYKFFFFFSVTFFSSCSVCSWRAGSGWPSQRVEHHLHGNQSEPPVHLVHSFMVTALPSECTWLTIEQEGCWIKPQSLTTRHVLIMEILLQNAQHQLLTHHILHKTVVFRWNPKLQVVGYCGIFTTEKQTRES